MCVRPIAMELYDVWMLQSREVIEYQLYLVFFSLEVFPLRELHLVPHNLDTLLGVHGEVCAVDTGDITLFHLEDDSAIISNMLLV